MNRRIKRYISLFLAALMVLTSINLSDVSAIKAHANEGEIVPALLTAGDFDAFVSGITKITGEFFKEDERTTSISSFCRIAFAYSYGDSEGNCVYENIDINKLHVVTGSREIDLSEYKVAENVTYDGEEVGLAALTYDVYAFSYYDLGAGDFSFIYDPDGIMDNGDEVGFDLHVNLPEYAFYSSNILSYENLVKQGSSFIYNQNLDENILYVIPNDGTCENITIKVSSFENGEFCNFVEDEDLKDYITITDEGNMKKIILSEKTIGRMLIIYNNESYEANIQIWREEGTPALLTAGDFDGFSSNITKVMNFSKQDVRTANLKQYAQLAFVYRDSENNYSNVDMNNLYLIVNKEIRDKSHFEKIVENATYDGEEEGLSSLVFDVYYLSYFDYGVGTYDIIYDPNGILNDGDEVGFVINVSLPTYAFYSKNLKSADKIIKQGGSFLYDSEKTNNEVFLIADEASLDDVTIKVCSFKNGTFCDFIADEDLDDYIIVTEEGSAKRISLSNKAIGHMLCVYRESASFPDYNIQIWGDSFEEETHFDPGTLVVSNTLCWGYTGNETTDLTIPYNSYADGSTNIVFAYVQEDGTLEEVLPFSRENETLIVDENMQVFYQRDEESEIKRAALTMNDFQGDLAIFPQENDYYMSFRKLGIYTFILKEDYDKFKTVKIRLVPGEVTVTDKRNEQQPVAAEFVRKSGETLTFSINDERISNYAIYVYNEYGYGVLDKNTRYFTAVDDKGRDVSDKIHHTNDVSMLYPSYVGGDFTGDVTLKMTDFAHGYFRLFVTYEIDGITFTSRCYEFLESEESSNKYVYDGNKLTEKPFLGFIITEEEYSVSQTGDYGRENFVVESGDSIQEVIDKLSSDIKKGAKNTGYLFVRSWKQDERNEETQFITTDVAGTADIKGILISGYDIPDFYADGTTEIKVAGSFIKGEYAKVYVNIDKNKAIINGNALLKNSEGRTEAYNGNGELIEDFDGTLVGSYNVGNRLYDYCCEFNDNADIFSQNPEGMINNLSPLVIKDSVNQVLTENEKNDVLGGKSCVINYYSESLDTPSAKFEALLNEELASLSEKTINYYNNELTYKIGYTGKDNRVIKLCEPGFYELALEGSDLSVHPEDYRLFIYTGGEISEIEIEEIDAGDGCILIYYETDLLGQIGLVSDFSRISGVSISWKDPSDNKAEYNYGIKDIFEKLQANIYFDESEEAEIIDDISIYGFKWVLYNFDGTLVNKDSKGNYPVGMYLVHLVNEELSINYTDGIKYIINIVPAYTIEYNFAGGTYTGDSLATSFNLKDTELIVLPSADEMMGSAVKFEGWYTENTYKNKIESIDPTLTANRHNFVLYAKFVPTTVTVNYVFGTTTKKQLVVCDTEEKLIKNTFKNSGKEFLGWSFVQNSSTPDFVTETGDTSVNLSFDEENPYFYTETISGKLIPHDISKGANIYLYPVWGDATYSIIYNLNGGAFVEEVPGEYTYSVARDFVLPGKSKITRTGYTFTGWYTNEELKGKAISKIARKSQGDCIFYAKWTPNTYTIKFNANGGSGKMDSKKFTYDKYSTMPANKFTKPGYEFVGWAESTDGEAVIKNNGSIFNLVASGSKIYYAVWVPVNYRMILDLRCDYEEVVEAVNLSFAYGYDTVTGIMLPSSLHRMGYTFGGWYTKSNYDKSSKITSTKGLWKDITVYAKWIANTYTLKTYKHSDDEVPAKTVTGLIYSKSNTISKYTDTYTDEEGNIYAFMGWDTNPSATRVVYKNNAKIPAFFSGGEYCVPEGIVLNLYAVWERVWNINYVINGGSIYEEYTRKYEYKNTADIVLPTPVREGYTFGGWYYDTKFNNPATGIKENSTGIVTVYAKWTAKKYNVTFNANAPFGTKATGTMKSQKSVVYNKATALSKNKFAVKGYTFLGWSTNPEATVPEYTNAQKVSNLGRYKEAVALYAVWSINTYTVKFVVNGSTEDSVSVKYGEVIDLGEYRNDAEIAGYTLKAWYTDKSCKKVAKTNNFRVTGNSTFYAKRTLNK